MTYSVALAGKGGTGKTTMAGLLIKYLVEKGKKPVLAVDADANANLNEVLGVEVTGTLGDAREQMRKNVDAGMTKDVFMEMKLQQAVVESEGYDLIVMGRPEGTGCYCAANTLLTQCLEKLIGNYPYIVMDNEAGMEHISRLTTNNIDLLIAVSDASRRGIQAASRIIHLSEELCLNIGQKVLVVNQAGEGRRESLDAAASDFGLEIAGIVPENSGIREFDLHGKPTIALESENEAVKAANEIFDQIIKG